MGDNENHRPVVLAIGGLDPSGGAGIALDSLAIQKTGCHPACIAAVLTMQTGRRFTGSRSLTGSETEATARLILADLDVRAIKVGALGTESNMAAVARLAGSAEAPPIVLDPVIRSTSGGLLLSSDAIETLKTSVIGALRVITPNIPEAEILTRKEIRTRDDMRRAGHALLDMGAQAVLLKGGHLQGDNAVDLLMEREGGMEYFESRRVLDRDVRGTGCALAALIAGELAKGASTRAAVVTAREILQTAIRRAVLIGPDIRVLDFDFAFHSGQSGYAAGRTR
jgi:hydroxymethylpyrimidine/phosphomethylpyrimidine kinase